MAAAALPCRGFPGHPGSCLSSTRIFSAQPEHPQTNTMKLFLLSAAVLATAVSATVHFEERFDEFDQVRFLSDSLQTILYSIPRNAWPDTPFACTQRS